MSISIVLESDHKIGKCRITLRKYKASEEHFERKYKASEEHFERFGWRTCTVARVYKLAHTPLFVFVFVLITFSGPKSLGVLGLYPVRVTGTAILETEALIAESSSYWAPKPEVLTRFINLNQNQYFWNKPDRHLYSLPPLPVTSNYDDTDSE